MKKAYFIGIGGIGISALAQHLYSQGTETTGSDREASLVTELLESHGIKVHIGHRAENVVKDADCVVYSDAVPEDNPERVFASVLGLPQYSYFSMLGKISENKMTVAVAGTHGKTTTTSMLTKIVRDAGISPTAIIGSLVKDFGSNYVHGTSDIFIVEACEYRDHLLQLSPRLLVITNLEWDHTDYFPSLVALQATFKKAIDKVPESGAIITDIHNANIAPLLAGAKAKVINYMKEPAYELLLPGEFNKNNARAAAAAARFIFSSDEQMVLSDTYELVQQSLATFQGTWRRFDYKGKNQNGADVYDDYAHHPTAIRETLRALRDKTSGKIIVAFHPHLYSRTRDLLEEFSTAFADADKVYVAPIYAAREVDDGSISSAMLAEHIRAAGIEAEALSFDAIEEALRKVDGGDTIMTMGAGDIYKIAEALVKK